MTASSQYGTICCSASEGRLNNRNKWLAASNDANPWIEVDLDEPTVVTGVITQGISRSIRMWVTAYKVAYKKQHSSDYEYVTDGNGDIKVFIGNTDTDTPVTNLFDESVVATVVRIEPMEWYSNYVAMRLELLGCRHN
ncbi:lactadherin-like [Patiria miniata]|uniref:F5/8 type C domain-containing protein n=1 Tax=Patiria miniata TaxID=46514 RepID=A0A914A9G6_PATMI|nr:lactadherin-like [Patiria miniata]